MGGNCKQLITRKQLAALLSVGERFVYHPALFPETRGPLGGVKSGKPLGASVQKVAEFLKRWGLPEDYQSLPLVSEDGEETLKLLTVVEVGKILSVPSHTVEQACGIGLLDCLRLPGEFGARNRRRIIGQSLHRFVRRFSTDEVGSLLGLVGETVSRYCKIGVLQSVIPVQRDGKVRIDRRIEPEELKKFLASCGLPEFYLQSPWILDDRCRGEDEPYRLRFIKPAECRKILALRTDRELEVIASEKALVWLTLPAKPGARPHRRYLLQSIGREPSPIVVVASVKEDIQSELKKHAKGSWIQGAHFVNSSVALKELASRSNVRAVILDCRNWTDDRLPLLEAASKLPGHENVTLICLISSGGASVLKRYQITGSVLFPFSGSYLPSLVKEALAR